MRILLVIFILLSCRHSCKADWDLFPLNQVSYYNYSYGIKSLSMDTIVNRGSYDALFFNRDYWGTSGIFMYQCMVNVNEPVFSYPLNGYLEMDSLAYRNDTVFYDSSLYFLPLAPVGQSWSFGSSTITCYQSDTMSIFGVVDSVKYYSYSTYDIILSKSHGFIRYIPFIDVLANSFYEHELIGLENAGGSLGFTKPGYLEYFPYQAGDLLFWKYSNQTPFGTLIIYYHKDSITNITYGADTIKYTYDRKTVYNDGSVQYYPNLEKSFLVSDMVQLLEMPTFWLTLQGATIYISYPYQMEADSSLTRSFYSDGFYFPDTDTCFIGYVFDVNYLVTYNSSLGFVRWEWTYWDINETLTGSVIGGVVRGDTALHVGIDQVDFETAVKVYPIPARDYINIESGFRIKEIRIYDIMGRLVYEEVINEFNKTLELSYLESGIYAITTIESGGRRVVRRLTKE